ncbi:MAG TPA: GNAT family N-acetyltransferase [Actinopolymorphaceae bacterium]|jgi:ribosomal-protein-alanine N-acetyltransferase
MQRRTKRLVLRDFVASDRESVRRWRSDPEVMRYLDQPRGSDPDSWFDTVLRHSAYHPRTTYDAAIVLRKTGDVIGWIGMGRTIDPGAGDLVVGYALGRQWWGHGYMTEALVAMLEFGFTQLGARAISAQYYVANPASARVMQKAGMRPAGRAVSANPALGESERYIAIRDEWRKPRRRWLGLFSVLLALGLLPAAAG